MNKSLSFVKFSATGNDFILFDNREHILTGKESRFFRHICARQTGVGADGVLLIENSEHVDFRMRYFNADGHEAEMCGNGARACAFYAFHNGITPARNRFEIGEDEYEAIVEGHSVSLLMHEPKNLRLKPGILEHDGLDEGGFADLGVPHYVLFTKDVTNIDVNRLGKHYCEHAYFQPRRTNVNFIAKSNTGELEMRTYERGVDAETLACGTGSVVSAFIASKAFNLSFPITVKARGGILAVSMDVGTGRPFLHGEVHVPFKGEIAVP